MRFAAFILVIAVVWSVETQSFAFTSDYNARCPEAWPSKNSAFTCTVQKLSWVRLQLATPPAREVFANDKESLERRMRNFMKRELPALKHEYIEPTPETLDGMSDFQKYSKSLLQCRIALSPAMSISQGEREIFRIHGIHTECQLFSFNDLSNGDNPSYSASNINVGKRQNLGHRVSEMIENGVRSMGQSFYQGLSNIEALTSD